MAKKRPKKSRMYANRRKTLMKYAPRKCPDCGRLMWSPLWGQKGGAHLAEATVDHIRPRSRGGSDALSNLRVCCRSCNEAKGNDQHLPGGSKPTLDTKRG